MNTKSQWFPDLDCVWYSLVWSCITKKSYLTSAFKEKNALLAISYDVNSTKTLSPHIQIRTTMLYRVVAYIFSVDGLIYV